MKVYEVSSGCYENRMLVGIYPTLTDAMATLRRGKWEKVEIPAHCVGHDENAWTNGLDWDDFEEIREIDEPVWLRDYARWK